MTQAQYAVMSRTNSNLQVAGIIDDFATLDMTLRYNDVSEWVMTIPRQSAHLPNLIPLSNPVSPANGNGIIVTRDYGNGVQSVILSGPITHVDYAKSSQLVTIKGVDDTAWLAWRSADSWPASYPYSTVLLALTPLRYYRLGESSGATATDSSSAPQNGTYVGSVGYSQAALIEDSNTCILFDGSTTYITTPTTGLPTVNASWTVDAVIQMASVPGATVQWACLGTSGTANGAIYFMVESGGKIRVDINGVTTLRSINIISANVPYHVMTTWNGTTLTLLVNGVVQATATPGALAMTARFTIGARYDGTTPSLFFPGKIDEVAVWTSALTTAQALLLTVTGWSRLVNAVSDNRAGLASTVMIAYANNNAGPGTLAKRQVANLTMAADPSVGGQVTGVARGDVLLDLLKNLALQSGDNIGFYIRQTLATGANTMAFTTYAPSDKTSNAIFSDEIGNLQDYSFSLDMPTANVITVGDGTATGAARAFLEVPDSASVTANGRIEGFAQGSSSQDYQTMLNAGQAALLQNKAASSLSITPIDTVGLMYQRDYNLGDKVSVYLEGQTIQDKLREVHISLTKGSGAGSPDEVITPAIGPVDVTQAAPSMISNLTKKNMRAQARLNKIERNR